MKTRKISIISLTTVMLMVVALMLGLSLTSGASIYSNADIMTSKTDVTFNNITVDTSSMTQYDENIAANAPEGAEAIGTPDELKNFINGTSTYGYLTADITYDKEASGSNRTFASGRTLDGNGHTLTLTTTASMATTHAFGLLFDINEGTLKNIKFNFNSTVSLENNSAYMRANHIGIVCGENNGTISNCDLYVTGSFSYTYKNGSIGDIQGKNEVYELVLGGLTGANNATIKNIVSNYESATINAVTRVCDTGGDFRLDGKALFGAISGRSMNSASVIENIITVSNDQTKITVDSNKANKNGDIWDWDGEEGVSWREAAAVQCGNSTYSHGVPGVISNVIVNWRAPYNSLTVGDTISQNAVVHGGPNTNVTVLDNQYNTDHCGCGTGTNAGEHTMSIGNMITLANATARIGIKDGKQVIEIKPNEGYILIDQTFNKYKGLNNDDSGDYDGVLSNGRVNLTENEENMDGYTLEIPAYQPCNPSSTDNTGNDYYWTLSVNAYAEVELGVNTQEVNYTGQNYMESVLQYTYNGNTYLISTDDKINLLNNGSSITQLSLPGEYNLSFGDVDGKIAYRNDEQKVVAFVKDATIPFKINYGNITPVEGLDNWLSKLDITFSMIGGQEGAADGYVYSVNASIPKLVKGLNMSSAFDTPHSGRTYEVYLTKDGKRVTNNIEFTVKVDANAPVISDVVFDYPVENYYSYNKITLKAEDFASGLKQVTINGVAMNYDEVTMTYSADLTNGATTVAATDNVGNVTEYKFDAKVDNTQPNIVPNLYYYLDGAQQSYAGNVVNSTLYVDLSGSTFGNGGGKLYYSVNDGEWQEYIGILPINQSCKIKFRAVSNTVDINTNEPFTKETANMNLKVQVKDIVITNNDIVITGSDKTFDGTDKFNGTVTFAEGVTFDTSTLTINAKYANVNAGETDIIVEVVSSSDAVRVVNEISGIKGNIAKKSISVTVNNATKNYRAENPVFTYTTDQVAGFEEKIILETNADINSLPGEYAITVSKTEYNNYVVESVVSGTLTVNKFVIDRMIYDFTTITGLDTNNAKGVVVGFMQANGEYMQFDVRYQYSATKDGEYTDCEGMTAAGYYKVILSLPEEIQTYYEIKSGIDSFIVKVIDASIFETEVEEGEEGSLQYVENYVNDDANTDNAAIVKDYNYMATPDYLIILSVFCACILVVIFSIGCGRIIISKHKENNHNKKA